MGIYLLNMEMPTGHPLWIVVHSDGTVEANEVSQSRPVGWQTLRNAAIPVKTHGRLIDADALEDELGRFCDDNWVYNTLHHAPTIIPAEEGET